MVAYASVSAGFNASPLVTPSDAIRSSLASAAARTVRLERFDHTGGNLFLLGHFVAAPRRDHHVGCGTRARTARGLQGPGRGIRERQWKCRRQCRCQRGRRTWSARGGRHRVDGSRRQPDSRPAAGDGGRCGLHRRGRRHPAHAGTRHSSNPASLWSNRWSWSNIAIFISLFFTLTGVVYGYGTKAFTTLRAVPEAMIAGVVNLRARHCPLLRRGPIPRILQLDRDRVSAHSQRRRSAPEA